MLAPCLTHAIHERGNVSLIPTKRSYEIYCKEESRSAETIALTKWVIVSSPFVGPSDCTACNLTTPYELLHGRGCSFVISMMSVHSMAKKSQPVSEPTPPSAPSTNDSAYTQQPRVLGWLVLLAGGFSTWYWYRPLPPSVSETTNSGFSTQWPTASTNPKSIWNDQGLIVPSLDVPIEVPKLESSIGGALASSSNQPSNSNKSSSNDLVGPAQVTLVPARQNKSDLAEILKNEKLPLVPIDNAPPVSTPTTRPPAPWIADDKSKSPPIASNTLQNTPPNTKVPQSDTVPASPFRTPTVVNKPPINNELTGGRWPDSDYSPATIGKPTNPQIVSKTAPPALLETGMRSIRLQDNDQEGIASKPIQPAIAPNSPPSREPVFIRQPRPKHN